MKPLVNSFAKAFTLAAALALLLQHPAGARAQGEFRQTGPFKISSRGTPFAVQVELEGTYTVYEHYVEVNVGTALVQVSERCPYQGRRFIKTLTVGLAAVTPAGRWEIENRSLPLVVERVMSPRDEYTLAGLYFQIPRSAAADMSKRWLVVEAEELALDLPEGDRDAKGYALAHSCRCVFANPGDETER